ncbi:MAG: type II toxin-antitoxin system RelE/ParE family toxin [Kiritimatiellae bacterium]|jgi:toxin ParE1/3/4|nr:type II toxin-antitoxin system RelE/ParE family toxin [Kiritimatiellia bacterium]MDD2349103.1 type II toxin-antitoxin system RelE/ParE family toxin [Kiritimatiellia bacterium]MDD3583804.1 type II toxin-antitoxin system RelE/ParE family toxin [Kiritimatiellia bacterium]HHU16414.1 type II toxin-antitoxin system RelE/ParE family toxin [Lentisphaerota bacterium]
MSDVRFSPQAISDLKEIKRYISEDLFNPQAATDLVALVFEKLGTLASMPQTGARLRTDIPVLKGYRFIQCKNYLVFYRMEGKEIVVIRILYARRDYLGLLEPNKGSTDNGRTNP